MGTRRNKGRKKGQALVELLVAIVAILTLLAGALFLARLGREHDLAMNEARRDADLAAGMGPAVVSPAVYVAECTAGRDGRKHTADDGVTGSDITGFWSRILAHGRPGALGQAAPGNAISGAYGNMAAQACFGLVRGRARRDVTVDMPAVRKLLYGGDVMQVEAEAWMVWTEGIY